MGETGPAGGNRRQALCRIVPEARTRREVGIAAAPPFVDRAGSGKSRLLYLPSVGFCLMLSLAVDGLRGRVRYVIPALILAFHFAALQHNLSSWEYASEKAQAVSAAAGKCAGLGTQRIAALSSQRAQSSPLLLHRVWRFGLATGDAAHRGCENSRHIARGPVEQNRDLAPERGETE
jgi:hypothetical protein